MSGIRTVFVTVAAVLTLGVLAGDSSAQLTDFFKDKVKDVPKLEEEVSRGKKLLGGGLGCIAGGAIGYYGGKEFAKMIGKDQPLSDEERERFMLGAALAGCAVGAAAGVKIIENMSESAKQAQLEAWGEAQQNTGKPVAWSDPNDQATRGTSLLVPDPEPMPSGESCGFRRDIIETQEGTVEPEQRVCQSDSGTWEPRLS